MTEQPVLVPVQDDDLEIEITDDYAGVCDVGYDAAPLGELLGELSARMSEVTTPEEAMALVEEVAAIHRQLAALAPAALQELARALTGVGASLSEASWQLALAPAEQAVTIYRDLVSVGYLPQPDLSTSLSKLLVFMSEVSTCAVPSSPRIIQPAYQ